MSAINGQKLNITDSTNWTVLATPADAAQPCRGLSNIYIEAADNDGNPSPVSLHVHIDGIDPVDASGVPTTPRVYRPGETHNVSGRDALGCGTIKGLRVKLVTGSTAGSLRWHADGV